MAAKTTKTKAQESATLPVFKTIEMMAQVSGIGENSLRELVSKGEIEYIAVGSKKLLTNAGLWDWYLRNRITPTSS